MWKLLEYTIDILHIKIFFELVGNLKKNVLNRKKNLSVKNGFYICFLPNWLYKKVKRWCKNNNAMSHIFKKYTLEM